jgi:hypothetical protein
MLKALMLAFAFIAESAVYTFRAMCGLETQTKRQGELK